jgi:multiple sugar transport system ATP-binding protein
VDLDIRDGEFVVFVGPSGCGKSTLLRLVAGLEDTSAGRVMIGGRDVNGLTPGERRIAMVFQSYALYPHMSVRKNLSFGLENLHVPAAEIARRTQAAARMLAIEDYLERKPAALSGGQRQRVAIGRAVVREPDVFLFDEPLSNLDAALRVQTRGEIMKLHRELRATMIYVTHDQVEAMTMADRIAVLRAGRLEQFGTPMALFERPANEFVATFIGSPKMNLFDATVAALNPRGATLRLASGHQLHAAVQAQALQLGAAVRLGVRPAHWVEAAEGGLPFEVDYAEALGTETFLYGAMRGSTVQTVVHRARHESPARGSVLMLGAAPEHVHVFDAATGVSVPRLSAAELAGACPVPASAAAQANAPAQELRA